MHIRKFLEGLEGSIDRNVDFQGNVCEVSDGNEEQIVRNWRQDSSSYKTAKNLAKLYSSVLW